MDVIRRKNYVRDHLHRSAVSSADRHCCLPLDNATQEEILSLWYLESDDLGTSGQGVWSSIRVRDWGWHWLKWARVFKITSTNDAGCKIIRNKKSTNPEFETGHYSSFCSLASPEIRMPTMLIARPMAQVPDDRLAVRLIRVVILTLFCRPIMSARASVVPTLSCVFSHYHRQHGSVDPWMPAGMGKRGTCPPPSGNVQSVFLCSSTYSKTLSIEIIYALFSQPDVGFWGIRPQTSTEAHSLDPTGGLSSPYPWFAHPWKKSCGRPCVDLL